MLKKEQLIVGGGILGALLYTPANMADRAVHHAFDKMDGVSHFAENTLGYSAAIVTFIAVLGILDKLLVRKFG